jgi:dipeptidase D
LESIINNLEPKKIFKYFTDICAIPHGSGNLDGIVKYLVDFAKSHNLKYIVDDAKNVIIYKSVSDESCDCEATSVGADTIRPHCRGELCEPVILQAHIDMVCVKDSTSTKDLSKDPLDIYIDGNYLRAKGTSLGADDGIGVAIILAVLDDKENKFPPIEALFTSDEENGMNGALAIDGKLFKGKKLINLDSETEGELTVSCAGGTQYLAEIPITRRGEHCEAENRRGEHCEPAYKNYELRINGLLGGHSGMEIHKGRANAIIELAYVLKSMEEDKIDFYLVSIEAGKFDNVICPEAVCEVAVSSNDENKFKNLISELDGDLKSEYQLTDKNITLTTKLVGDDILSSHVGASTASPLDHNSTQKIIDILVTIPQGLIEISQEFINIPWTSLNLGVIKTEEDKIVLSGLIRSNNEFRRTKLVKKFETIIINAGGKFFDKGHYPAWEYNKNSKLKEDILKAYKDSFGKDMTVVATHGGLESGLFIEKIKGLEVVSMGPTMEGVHSIDEKLQIDTVGKLYDFLVKFLKSH